MAIFAIHHPLAFTFGLLGNIISFLVYFAPLPTFYRVYKRKSTEGFHSVPYVVALFSAMLWLYYAFIKSNAMFLITTNSFGCIIELIYIAMYFAYAPREARIVTVRLFVLLNVLAFSLILLLTQFLVKGSSRVQVLGWVCASISVSVFAAPLSIVAQVIRTKSVEYMPFILSFFLTLSAIMWFSYGLLLRDFCVALPNILGMILGLVQMVLYGMYRNANKVVKQNKVPEHIINMVMLSTLGPVEVHPLDAQPSVKENGVGEDEEKHEQTQEPEKDNNEVGEDEKKHEQTVQDSKESVASAPDDLHRTECAV